MDLTQTEHIEGYTLVYEVLDLTDVNIMIHIYFFSQHLYKFLTEKNWKCTDVERIYIYHNIYISEIQHFVHKGVFLHMVCLYDALG